MKDYDIPDKFYPLTINNDWNRLYEEYPERYKLFCQAPCISGDNYITHLHSLYDVNGKILVDVGSGAGDSSFIFKSEAKFIYGIEPEESMRNLAIQRASKENITNIKFLSGTSSSIPLESNSADVVIAITCASLYNRKNILEFIDEAERVTKPRGLIFSTNIAPNNYGGELFHLLDKEIQKECIREDKERSNAFESRNFQFEDYENVKNYGTLTSTLKSYGFIFGDSVISYLKKHNKTNIRWKWRIYYKILPD